MDRCIVCRFPLSKGKVLYCCSFCRELDSVLKERVPVYEIKEEKKEEAD